MLVNEENYKDIKLYYIFFSFVTLLYKCIYNYINILTIIQSTAIARPYLFYSLQNIYYIIFFFCPVEYVYDVKSTERGYGRTRENCYYADITLYFLRYVEKIKMILVSLSLSSFLCNPAWLWNISSRKILRWYFFFSLLFHFIFIK